MEVFKCPHCSLYVGKDDYILGNDCPACDSPLQGSYSYEDENKRDSVKILTTALRESNDATYGRGL